MHGHRHGFFHQLVVVDAFPDQAPLLGLFGAEFFAQHGQTGGAGLADQARQMIRAAGIGNQAQFAERFDKAGRAGGDDDIAGQRKIGAGAGGDAVDGADDRHWQRAQR